MKERFIDRAFKPDTLALIEFCNSVIAEYQAQGFTLTLRQLYYQCVARDRIPNEQKEYKRLGSIVNDARMAGLIDWSAIEDRGREVARTTTWTGPDQILAAVASQFKVDLWETQPARVMVRIEKDALLGVIEPVCKRWRVPYIGCRGYTSQSEAYAAGQEFAGWAEAGQRIIVLYLGDHDPSGIDMTRDNEERLKLFSREHVDVRRLALNIQQVNRYKPPPNPAKETDARFTDYLRKFGESCWELDALDPTVIDKLIDDELRSIVDPDAWEQAHMAEAVEKAKLKELAGRWDAVTDWLARS